MSADQPHVLAGAGRRCINPPSHIAHGGWGAQKHEQAEGIDMDLWTTALALSDGAASALLLDVDVQILTNERADQIRTAVSQATGVPVAHIRASATHTHSGPVPYKSWIEKGFELVEPWFENLCRWSAEAAAEAWAARQPAQIRAGRGECRINVNRRATTSQSELFLGKNRDGPCDHEVLVVQLDTAKGDPIATLVNYACHPTIMGPPNRFITPDFPGAMKRVVEDAVGGKCLFLLGAAGDQGPVQGFQGDLQTYRRLGAILGHEAAKVALGLNHIPSSEQLRAIQPSGAPLGLYNEQFASMPGLPLRVVEQEISVPLREALPDRNAAAEKLEFWQNRLKTARAQKDETGITEAIFMARRADIQLRLASDFGGRSSAGIRTHFICFGDVALVGCNVEPFCEIGLAIKQASPFPVTFVSGYTNGRLAYLPTATEWERGGYEVENSPFGEGAAEALQRRIIEVLHELRSGQRLPPAGQI